MMRPDMLVYLSGPITPKHGYSAEDNVASALKVHLALLNTGIPNFCPQLSGAFPSAWTSVNYETWMAYDFAIIGRCTHMLMLPRWETSTGALREKAHAEALGIPVIDTDGDFLLAAIALNSMVPA